MWITLSALHVINVLSSILIGITSTLIIISYRKIDNICSENDDLKIEFKEYSLNLEVIQKIIVNKL